MPMRLPPIESGKSGSGLRSRTIGFIVDSFAYHTGCAGPELRRGRKDDLISRANALDSGMGACVCIECGQEIGGEPRAR